PRADGSGGAGRHAGAGAAALFEEPVRGDDHGARSGWSRFREAGQAPLQAVRDQAGGRPGRGQGKDLPHRAPRVLRRLRRAGGDRRRRARPARPGREGRAGRGAGRSPAQLRGAAVTRILISDDLSPEAKTILERIPGAQVDFRVGLKPSELREIIGGYDALAVRSATKVTAEVLAAAPKLRVIGRAGTGVDNIDLAAATRRGVVVMNAPGGNSVSVAEHTLALLLALARQVSDASQSTRGGKWEKKKYSSGREVLGKTLGVIGTGNIGALVVQRAKA